MTPLFLHAFPFDGRMWKEQVERFGGVAPTLYGAAPSLEEWGKAALERIEGDVALVGSSMGGYVALAAARVAPERVKALVLVGSRADADSPDRRDAREETIRLLREQGIAPVWAQLRDRLFSPQTAPDVVEVAEAIVRGQSIDDLVRATEAMRDRADSTDVLRQFDGRLLVVVGDEDPFVGPDHFEPLVPPESLHVVPGGGHLLGMERPQLLNGLLEEVLV